MDMTKDCLRKLCKSTDGCYGTPHINDKLYLHYKGFNKIKNLDEYTGLKAIWLEGNGFGKIEGLGHQPLLRTLYLHENIIEVLEGLDKLLELDSINLSKNFIKKVENLSHLKKLTSINLSHNHLTSLGSIEHLQHVPSLQTIDLQHNKLTDPDIIELLAKLPDLRVLYLQGNPVVKAIPYYRKTVVYKCKGLRYLDDRPIFDEERRRTLAWSEAFNKSGLAAANEAEREELTKMRKEKEEYDLKNLLAFEQLMIEGQAIRKQREAAEAATTATTTAGTVVTSSPVPEVNPFSGEAIVHVPESDKLRIERERKLAAWSDGQCSLLVPPPPPPPTFAIEEIAAITTASTPSTNIFRADDLTDVTQLILPPPPPTLLPTVAAEGSELAAQSIFLTADCDANAVAEDSIVDHSVEISLADSSNNPLPVPPPVPTLRTSRATHTDLLALD